MKLFLILVKTCDNELLAKDGWRPGLIVCDADTAYGPTLRLQDGDELTCYTSRAAADRAKSIGDSFVGVTFEVAEFKRV